jgi:hypothetical protein
MRTTTIRITPELAEKLLAYNATNRKIRARNVNYFATCLRDGSFHTTHQGIAISGTIYNPERLFDGQHRLLAIIKTGIAADIQVTENASRHCFENVDSGVPRTLADRTGLSGKEVSICSAFYYLCSPSTTAIGKPSVDKLHHIREEIDPFLLHVPLSGNRGTGLAGFSCAFICQQRETGENLSEMFNSINPEKTKQLALVNPLLFQLRIRQTTLRTRIAMRHSEAFCFVMDAIAYSGKRSRLHVRKNSGEEAQQHLKTCWRELFEICRSGVV